MAVATATTSLTPTPAHTARRTIGRWGCLWEGASGGNDLPVIGTALVLLLVRAPPPMGAFRVLPSALLGSALARASAPAGIDAAGIG